MGGLMVEVEGAPAKNPVAPESEVDLTQLDKALASARERHNALLLQAQHVDDGPAYSDYDNYVDSLGPDEQLALLVEEEQKRIGELESKIERTKIQVARESLYGQLAKTTSKSFVERARATDRLRFRTTAGAGAMLATAVSMASAGIVPPDALEPFRRVVIGGALVVVFAALHQFWLMVGHGMVELVVRGVSVNAPQLRAVALLGWLQRALRLLPAGNVSVQLLLTIWASVNLVVLVEAVAGRATV